MQDGFYRLKSQYDLTLSPAPGTVVREVPYDFHARQIDKFKQGRPFMFDGWEVPRGAILIGFDVKDEEFDKVANITWTRRDGKVWASGTHENTGFERTGSHYRGKVILKFYVP